MKPIPFILFFACIVLPGLAQTDSGNIVTTDSSRILNTVIFTGTLSTRALKQQPVNISIVDVRPFYSTNLSGLDLLRQTSGIKIKQNGGFGSNSEFFINGSSGKQIKFFIDGLPQDNLGETQLLNIYPVEQIERLEVYKGVLPVELGADALGGAINIVTRKEKEDYINASYSVASFNTHKLNILGKKYLTGNLFAAVQANLNYADNNYTVQAGLIQPNGKSDTIHTRLFHDRFKNYNIQFQVGLTDKPFADHLSLAIIRTGMYDELQHSLMMMQPYGHVYRKENLSTAIVRYYKSNLFKNFDASGIVSYNRVNSLLMDTSLYSYLWNGEVSKDLNGNPQRKLKGGELSSSGHELYGYTDVINGKFTGAYHLSEQARLVFSNTIQHFQRTGRDPVAQEFYGGKDYYRTPSEMLKNIAGLGVEGKSLSRKWKYLASLKHYYTRIKGFEINNQDQTLTKQSLSEVAFNAGVAYQLNNVWQVKTSYEHAARLPEPEEAFGDFTYVRPNTTLKAEKSENFNLNILLNTRKADAELTGFYRSVRDLIYLPPSQFYSRYDNLLNANIMGVEGNFRYQVTQHFSLAGNCTFQNIRNRSNISNRPIDNGRYKNSRLPNIPYFFTNGMAIYKLNNFLGSENVLQLWYHTNYTHEYYLYWAEDGDSELKNRIPSQLLHHAGISYAPSNTNLSFALESINLTDARAYDNFKVQLPGRSFSFKIRYYQVNKK